MNKNKIMGIISILIFIIGWILYSKVGLILPLIVIMIILLFTTGLYSNIGNKGLIEKSKQIQETMIK